MAWADVTLAEAADVRERYPRVGEICESEVKAAQDKEITEFIAKAKAFIGRKLDVIILSRYADREFQAADSKDLITNPSVLKDSCVAWTLKLMFENVELNEGDYNSVKKQDFETEFKEEFNIASALLKFDEDEGQESDTQKRLGLAENVFYRT